VPNLEFELERYARQQGAKVTFNREAREAYLRFATSPEALWSGNFATVRVDHADGHAGARWRIAPTWSGRRSRPRRHWRAPSEPAAELVEAILGERAADVDLFERAQLELVLRVCSESKSLSDAGRRLFAVSRTRKASSNDADRLRKYLARFGLDWEMVAARR
jgi:transcriptional regulatory protein RtcR